MATADSSFLPWEGNGQTFSKKDKFKFDTKTMMLMLSKEIPLMHFLTVDLYLENTWCLPIVRLVLRSDRGAFPGT